MTASHPSTPKAKGSSNLVRARFGAGMLLRHDDLEQMNAYTRDLSRLLFSSLFGCGVICGLKVVPTPKCEKLTVAVEPGVALDCAGDPIHVTKKEIISVGGCDAQLKAEYWVVLCGTEKSCAPRAAMCPSDDEEMPSTYTRERFGYEIQVLETRPDCACHCEGPDRDPAQDADAQEEECKCVAPKYPCHVDHYEGKCNCSCGDCSDCDCECILLARLTLENESWKADHSVRRFIRPALLPDPLATIAPAQQAAASEPAPAPAATETAVLTATTTASIPHTRAGRRRTPESSPE